MYPGCLHFALLPTPLAAAHLTAAGTMHRINKHGELGFILHHMLNHHTRVNTHKTASSPKEKGKERAGGRKRERREEGKEAKPHRGKNCNWKRYRGSVKWIPRFFFPPVFFLPFFFSVSPCRRQGRFFGRDMESHSPVCQYDEAKQMGHCEQVKRVDLATLTFPIFCSLSLLLLRPFCFLSFFLFIFGFRCQSEAAWARPVIFYTLFAC